MGMGMYHKVKVGKEIFTPIDWEMCPELSFGTYESWGGRERVRNNDECVYYFFIDNWGEKPKLCLMERAVKHAKVVAEVKAPRKLIEDCVNSQGKVALYERTYGINAKVRDWLIDNVLDDGNQEFIVPLEESKEVEYMGDPLPELKNLEGLRKVSVLPSEPTVINDEDIGQLIKKWDFFDADLNPEGRFENDFAAFGNDVVIDHKTGLMWQRGGLDIMSLRSMQNSIKEVNKKGFAGFNDWRLPTMEEAMSLMETELNDKGVYLKHCFSKEQPFIFVAAQRQPGGHWFVDYKQGRAFWSSGTIPGGFGRLVRKI